MMVIRGFVILVHSVGPLERSQQPILVIFDDFQGFLMSPYEGDGGWRTACLSGPLRTPLWVQPVDHKASTPPWCALARASCQPVQQTRRPTLKQHDHGALPQPNVSGSLADIVQEGRRQQVWIVISGLVKGDTDLHTVSLIVRGHFLKQIALGWCQELNQFLLDILVDPGRQRTEKLPNSIHRG